MPWYLCLTRHLDGAGHDADLLLESERRRARLALLIEQRQEHGGPYRRMAGEGQFASRREDSDIGALARLGSRKDEDCLGEVELLGDPLHRSRVEPLGVEHDRERISGEALAREDIEGDKATGHADQTSSTSKRRVGETNSSCAAMVRISREPASSVRLSKP